MLGLNLSLGLASNSQGRNAVSRMVSAIRRIGGSLWMVDNAFSGAFVDNVGTTPVTAVADLIGLITDKSYGGQLGPNLVTNGDFSSGTTGWTVPAGWALSSGAMVATSASSSLLQQGAVSTVGRSYEVEFDWTRTGGTLYVRVGAGTAATFTSSGRKRVILVAASAAGVEFSGGAVSGTLDNITSKEVPGNHATQSAVASKPSVQRIGNATVISFDGSNDFLQTGITTGNEGWVCAGVAHNVAATAIVFSGGGENATQAGAALRMAGGPTGCQLMLSDGVTGQVTQSPVATVAPGTPFVYEGGWDASTRLVGVDGAIKSAAKTINCASSLQSRIGDSVTGGLPLNGPMHAIAYTPILPSAADRATIRNGIAALQGRTL